MLRFILRRILLLIPTIIPSVIITSTTIPRASNPATNPYSKAATQMTVIPGKMGMINSTNPNSMILSVNQNAKISTQAANLSLGFDFFHPTHPGLQDWWNPH